MTRKIDISHKTVIFISLFVLGLWATYLILDLLILLFVSLILTSALSPVIDFFSKFKLPKALGIVLTYIIILVVVGVVFATLVTPLIEESRKLISVLPPLIAQEFNIDNFDERFYRELAGFSANIFSFSLIVFNNIITIIFLLVITFYLLLEREKLEERFSNLFIGKEERVKKLIIKIEEKLGAWFRGQLLLTVIIGVLIYLGLSILKVPYALALALLAGVMEVVPVIGPIIAAIPAVALAFTITPVLGLGVASMYFIIQQVENNIVVPQVMKRAVGLNPLAVILAIAVGSRLLGVGGALLAVPVVVVAQILLNDILIERKED